MWEKIALYAKKYPARISGYISALILYANKHFPDLPVDIIVPSVMILIGLGETAQRLENKKTLKALWADNNPNIPDEEVIDNLIKKG